MTPLNLLQTPSLLNDEPTSQDHLGHISLVRLVAEMILDSNPPYVIGVCGTWGAGKTSFLRKLWSCFGEVDDPPYGSTEIQNLRDYLKRHTDHFEKFSVVWFNPWHHQFENSPVLALIQEMRQQLSFGKRAAEAMKSVVSRMALDTVQEKAKAFGGFWGNAASKGIEVVKSFDATPTQASLTSQHFQELFEKAVEGLVGEDGRLIFFIDDLDRCEGPVAYKLLESLKLYLNAKNCIYVLGMDQVHLEETIATTLSGNKDTPLFRPLARNYLNKMFQSLFLLPVPKKTDKFIKETLNIDHPQKLYLPKNSFKEMFEDVCEMPGSWNRLYELLDQNLPPNPRKIKSFLASWKLYLKMLAKQRANNGEKLDWQMTIILNYLGQFEEPLFREVEYNPHFFEQDIVRFAQYGENPHYLFKGLRLPPDLKPMVTAEMAEGASSPSKEPNKTTDSEQYRRIERTLWICRLVRTYHQKTLQDPTLKLNEIIQRHLVWTGKTCEIPVSVTEPVNPAPEETANGNNL